MNTLTTTSAAAASANVHVTMPRILDDLTDAARPPSGSRRIWVRNQFVAHHRLRVLADYRSPHSFLSAATCVADDKHTRFACSR
jgi:hypothetical protein